AYHRDLHSFPTRRSSDLEAAGGAKRALQVGAVGGIEQFEIAADRVGDVTGVGGARIGGVDISERAIGLSRPDWPGQGSGERAQRSEEHTSELQSRENLVC